MDRTARNKTTSSVATHTDSFQDHLGEISKLVQTGSFQDHSEEDNWNMVQIDSFQDPHLYSKGWLISRPSYILTKLASFKTITDTLWNHQKLTSFKTIILNHIVFHSPWESPFWKLFLSRPYIHSVFQNHFKPIYGLYIIFSKINSFQDHSEEEKNNRTHCSSCKFTYGLLLRPFVRNQEDRGQRTPRQVIQHHHYCTENKMSMQENILVNF